MKLTRLNEGCFCSLLLAAAALAGAQPAPKPGSVSGLVINSVTKGPAGKATVALHNTAKGFAYATVADDAGRFQFPSVEPGPGYVLTADAPGFLQDWAHRARPFTVAEDQRVTGITAPVMPGGAIAGKVVDADGDPLSGVQVTLLLYGYESGKRQLRPSQTQATDDRGEYRLSLLGPGRYYLAAKFPQRQADPPGRMHRNGPDLDYALTFYPKAPDVSGAAPIDLAPGGEIDGIDFRLQKIRLYHIRGKIAEYQGSQQMPMAVAARCEPGEPQIFNASGASPIAAKDGSFDIPRTAPGAYCVSAQANRETARQTVTITDRDVDNLTLTMTPTFPVKGSVAVEGAPLDNWKNFRITLMATVTFQARASAQVRADGSFVLENAQPLTYSLQYDGLPENAYIKSISLNGREAPDGRINLTSGADTLKLIVATDTGQVSGSLRSANGGPAAGAAVVIAAAGPSLRQDRIQSALTDANGNFTLTGIPPGGYQVFAFEQIDINSMAAPEYRQPFESMAASITVHANGHETVDVKVISADQVDEALKKLR